MIFIQNLLALLLEAAPWLVFGLFLGGLIKALIPVSFLNKHLKTNSLSSVVKAALLGAPLPLCSCGVIPVALGLRQAGASKSATTSFLVSTPETGIDSISISYALLGPFMTVVRPVAALSSALVSGLLVIFFDREKSAHEQSKNHSSENNKQSAVEGTSCCASEKVLETNTSQEIEKACCDSEPVAHDKTAQLNKVSSSCCDSDNVSTEQNNPVAESWLEKSKQGVHYSFTQLLDDIVVWLMIGMFFAALANTFLPPSFFIQWGQGLTAMIIIMLAGIPMYICATASTPIAASLILAGVSPGVALVLMLTGPATNISTLGVIKTQLGNKTMWLYLIGVSVSALICGLLVDVLVNAWNIDINAQLMSHGHSSQIIQWSALVLLIALATRRYYLAKA